MTPAIYRDLLRLARRHSRREGEAEDVVQDALLAAVAAGRDVDLPANRPWIAGTIRRQAAFAARTAVRRARRESGWSATMEGTGGEPAGPERLDRLMRGLRPAAKAVAALAFSGHSRAEIGYLLGIGDAALRQRIAGLKRDLQRLGIDMPAGTPGLTLGLDYGRIRDALLPRLVREGGLFASHDPDGHLFVVRRSQSGVPRQQAGEPPARSQP